MSKPLGKPDRIVVALGGNALGNNPCRADRGREQHRPRPPSASSSRGQRDHHHPRQRPAGRRSRTPSPPPTMPSAPPEMPLPECGAMSRATSAITCSRASAARCTKRYKRWHAATVVTQIECDPDDPAFKNPTKPIGPFYTEEQAKEFMAEDPLPKVFVEDSGRGWRRVVASPIPRRSSRLTPSSTCSTTSSSSSPAVAAASPSSATTRTRAATRAFPPSSTRTWAASCWPRIATLTFCSC